MASWQFDFHLLPRIGVERQYGIVPLGAMSKRVDEDNYWNGFSLTTELRAQLSQLLPPLNAWHADVERWGYEDGNRIDVVLEKGAIVDLMVRVDVRELSQVFLVGVLKVARQNDWLVNTEDGRVARPLLSRLLAEIHASQAFRFVRNPNEFLEALKFAQNRDEEQPPHNEC